MEGEIDEASSLVWTIIFHLTWETNGRIGVLEKRERERGALGKCDEGD